MLFLHDVKCLQLEEERTFKEELTLQQHVKRLKPRTKHSRQFLFFAFACRYGPEIDYVADEVSQEYYASFFVEKWGTTN
jgi:hypothetical protein